MDVFVKSFHYYVDVPMQMHIVNQNYTVMEMKRATTRDDIQRNMGIISKADAIQNGMNNLICGVYDPVCPGRNMQRSHDMEVLNVHSSEEKHVFH